MGWILCGTLKSEVAVGPFDKCAVLSLTTQKVCKGLCGMVFFLSAIRKEHTHTHTPHTQSSHLDKIQNHHIWAPPFLTSSVLPPLLLPTLSGWGSWGCSLCSYLEDPFLCLLLLLCFSLPCLSGDHLARNDGSLQRLPAWQNCYLSPFLFCFTLRKEAKPTNQTP